MGMYPKKVYVIFPFNQFGNVAGVYVGISQYVKTRIRNHRNNYVTSGKPAELHELMRKYGYAYTVIDEIQNWQESHVEYDWIDFFIKRTKLTVFNNQINLCNADWHRLKGINHD